MARYLSSTELIESIKDRAQIPENQITFTPERFLRFATQELDAAIVPYVMQYHEDYFLVTEDIPLVSGQSKYSIPYRAIGNKLRDVSFLDQAPGLPSTTIFEMTRVSIEDVSFYQYGGSNGAYSNNGLRAFYMADDQICLLPEDIGTGPQTGFLRVSYYIRPNQLVLEERIATITSINRTTGEIGVANIPANITLGVNLDLIKVKSPHKCLVIDVQATNINTNNNTITFDLTDIPANLVVGDMIALAEECSIPMIPTDMHSMLAQRVACRCLEALGFTVELQNANLKLSEMEQKGATVIDNRVEGAPFKITNRHSFLNRSRQSNRS
jgi:hypothetical protein